MNSLTSNLEGRATGRRVLLVEDSSVTQDIVELMLTQAGHSVTIASDGASALIKLQESEFDVVLTDFHLPDITGLDVVKRFRSKHAGGRRPTFVAITGDVRGLLSDRANCEVFDRIVPKPLDIDLVCELVETPSLPSVDPPNVSESSDRNTIEALPFAYHRWPDISRQGRISGLRGIDAILVTAANGDLDTLWRQAGANLLPVIDMTGTLGPSADMDGSAIRLGDTDHIAELVDLFHERRSEIHSDLVESNDPADRLLARLHVGGGSLIPRRSGSHRSLLAWNLIAGTEDIDGAVHKLAAEGLLETAFFERVHHCPGCLSARLLVREECPACGSAHLEEASYLHHFRCAFQGPETKFRQQDELICPKCRRTLAHFGRDYDRPGLMVQCRGCAATTSEPQVAFVCTDCGIRTSTDAIPTRDILSARVTEAGLAYLSAGSSFFGPARKSLRLADLPLDLVIALNKAASHFNENAVPFVLGSIAYDGIADIRSDHGARQAQDVARLWLETLKQGLPTEVMVTHGNGRDFLLAPRFAKADFEPELMAARQRADAAVRFDPCARFQLFGPADITG